MNKLSIAILIMLMSCVACTRKCNDIVKPSEPEVGSTETEVAFNPYSDTFKLCKYLYYVYDTPAYIYVHYFERDSVAFSSNSRFSGGSYGQIIRLNTRLNINDSNIYINNNYYNNIEYRKIWFKEDSIVYEWVYKDEVFKDPTGGVHYEYVKTYGKKVRRSPFHR